MVHSIYVECRLVLMDALNLIYLQLIQNKTFVSGVGSYSVSTMVKDITDLVMWKERGRDIQIEVKDGIAEGSKLSFDQRSLRVILFNVITNALKFQEKGNIFIIAEVLI